MRLVNFSPATAAALVSALTLSAPSSWAQSSGGNPLDALPAVPSPPPRTGSVQLDLEPQRQLEQQLLALEIDVSQVNVAGATALPFEQVSARLAPLSGQKATVAQINAAVQQITELYQSKGYALSFAYLPAQDFANGVVQVQVVEGFIQSLDISGELGKSQPLIEELAQPLLAEKPLTTATFQRQTQLMARLPGIEIAASANLPTTTDGATALVLRSKYKPITVSLGGEVRKPTPKFIGSVVLNDPLWGGSQIQLSSLLRDFDRERFLSASFVQILGSQGATARATYSDYRSRNDPLTRQPGIDEQTQQQKLDIGVSHPWTLSATEQLSTTIGFYGINYRKGYWVESAALSIRDEESVRALYGQAQWSRNSPTMSQFAQVMLSKGLDAMGAGLHRSNSAGLPMAENPVKVDFTRVTLDYSQRHRFANRLGAAFAVGGQYSPDVLPAPERISFGGARFGRGYASGEFAGDGGVGASAEVNYQFVLDAPWLKSIEPYVLYEHAKTSQQLSGMPTATLRSTTLGARFSDNRYFSLDLGVSKPHGIRSVFNPERKLRYGVMLTYNLDI